MKLGANILKSILQNAKIDRGSKNIYSNCPWCGENEFGISTGENHPFNCFRKKKCGVTGNIYKLLHKLDRLDLINTIKYTDDREKLNTELLFDEIEQNNIDINLPTIKKPLGFKRIFNDSYLEGRGFKSFEKIEVGISNLDYKLKNYVIFLIYENKELKAYVSRLRMSKKEVDKINDQYKKANSKTRVLRYKNSETDFSKLLGGYDEIIENETKTVILVEGILDKENVDKLLSLDKNNKLKCNCTFKSYISKEQIIKLKIKGVTDLILMYDPDVIDKIKENAIDIMDSFNIKIALLRDNIDPGDATFCDLQKALSNQFDPLIFFTKKVQIKTF